MTASPRAFAADDFRVLLVAPTRRDADITQRALTQSGLEVYVCRSVERLLAETRRGAAALLLTDEFIESASPAQLSVLAEHQPEWSDLPFIVLARSGPPSPAVSWLQTHTSVTLLERMVQIRTLVSAVWAAVRARSRQYQVRDLLNAERQARLEADRANEAKDRFVAVLSHELRTPLTPVVFALASLQQEIPPDSNLQAPLDMIRRNVALETKLIDDLLDLSRIVQGKLQLQQGMVNLHDKLRDTLAMVDSDARAKRVTVNTAFTADAYQVFADPARIQQVFWNLVKNAIKFTNPGGAIAVSTWNEADAFMLACVDDGIGITGDVLPLIFEPFQQGSEEITRHYGGLGLGLALCRSLIEAHGGSMKAHSDGAGKGATFTLRLPNAVTHTLPSESAWTSPVTRNGDGRGQVKILLVEDHADTADALRVLLTVRGYDVRIVHSVADALRAAAADRVDLLISDIGLPDGSGLDLMRQISPRPLMGAIALSGFGMEDDLRQSLDAGFLCHLIKPVDTRQLEATIADMLDQSGREHDVVN